MDLVASYDSESEDEALSPRPLVELKSDLRLVIIRASPLNRRKKRVRSLGGSTHLADGVACW